MPPVEEKQHNTLLVSEQKLKSFTSPSPQGTTAVAS